MSRRLTLTQDLDVTAEPCDLFLDEHELGRPCGDESHRVALAARRGGAPKWSPIERGRDAGGGRDFLDGRPIHCGTGLELQAIEYKSDDYGEYVLALPTGVRVRYEIEFVRDPAAGENPKRIVLYTTVGAIVFRARHEAWMRFRWPQGGRS